MPRGKVYVIDDDEAMRDSLDFLLNANPGQTLARRIPTVRRGRGPIATLTTLPWSRPTDPGMAPVSLLGITPSPKLHACRTQITP